MASAHKRQARLCGSRRLVHRRRTTLARSRSSLGVMGFAVVLASHLVTWQTLLSLAVASLAAVKLDVDGSFHGHRSLQASLSPSSPDYYDALRIDLASQQTNATRGENSSIYQVSFLADDVPTTLRLAEIKSFLPFSRDGVVLVGNWNEGFGVLLALDHLNRMHERGHPVLKELIASDPVLSNCNIRFTIELFDGQFSPSTTVQTMTSVVRRRASLASPPATAVIGAHYSSETLPLAIYTGVNHIPQISASATSSELDAKELYPIFGRTVTSTDGEAAVAARFFQELQATHVAIVFVVDPYVSALQKAFVVEAAKLNITTESLVYRAAADEQDMLNVMAWLKRLQYRHVFSICFEDKLELVLNAAVDMGTVGPDYLWVWPAFDVFILQETLTFKDGSPLSRAMHGVGLIQMQGTISQERFVIGREQEPPMFDENSTQGSDRFRVSWRDALQDADFVRFVQSKLPVSLEEATGFDRSENFTGNPHGFLNFNYDAVTALGLAMCRAGQNKTFFTGDDIYHEFLRSDFEGASGNIRIIPETGTRHHTTISFVVWNVRIIGVNADGYSIIEYAPSYRLDDGSWKEIPGNAFVYADGSTSAPNALPPVLFNYNYIGGPSRAVAYSLMAVTMLASMASIIWTVFYRHSHVVDSAQPLFLISVSIGAFIMVSSVVALGFEETLVEHHESLNSACMAIPWLYFIGTSIALSGLLAKTEAVHQAYVNPDVEEIQVTSYDIMRFGMAMVPLIVAVLAIWTFTEPLEWTRIEKDKTDSFGRALESAASCESKHAVWFATAVIGIIYVFLVLGTIWAYRIRNISTEYNESRHIGLAIAALLQTWSMGIPVLIAVKPYPVPTFFIEAGLIILTSGLILALVFLPKVLTVRSGKGPRHPRESYIATFTMEPNRANNNRTGTEQSTEETVTPPTNGSQRRLGARHDPNEGMAPHGRRASTALRIVHNPRSPRNLFLGGGHEFSIDQLRLFRRSSRESSNSIGRGDVSNSSASEQLHQSSVEFQIPSAQEDGQNMARRASEARAGSLTQVVEVPTGSDSSRDEGDESTSRRASEDDSDPKMLGQVFSSDSDSHAPALSCLVNGEPTGKFHRPSQTQSMVASLARVVEDFDDSSEEDEETIRT